MAFCCCCFCCLRVPFVKWRLIYLRRSDERFIRMFLLSFKFHGIAENMKLRHILVDFFFLNFLLFLTLSHRILLHRFTFFEDKSFTLEFVANILYTNNFRFFFFSFIPFNSAIGAICFIVWLHDYLFVRFRLWEI